MPIDAAAIDDDENDVATDAMTLATFINMLSRRLITMTMTAFSFRCRLLYAFRR